MRQLFIITIVVLVGFSFTTNAQMKLKLPSEISFEQNASLGNNNLQSNMKLEVQPNLSAPGQMEFIKGLFLLGLALDISFPMGDYFSNSAGTGFSGHAFIVYMLTRSILLNFSLGYIRFGSKDFSGPSWTQTNTHSEIPILLGLSYLFNMRGALRVYVGLALGLFLLRDSYEGTNTFMGVTNSFDDSNTETKFGIVPRIGLFYMTAAILLTFEVTYSLIFQEAGGPDSSNLAHLGLLFGIMFALGK